MNETTTFFEFTDEDLNELNNVEPLKAYPPDEDVTVEITELRTDREGRVIRLDKNGEPFVMYEMEVRGTGQDDDYKSFTHFIWLFTGTMEAKKKRERMRDLKEFISAFNLDWGTTVDFSRHIGAQAQVILKVDESEEYGEQNRIKRYLHAK